ncbi:TetR/AcrR family transcriptional regulator [Georgenia yuyongxinii]|uniref:TetR/AcrR family transcriptional regulator n=1 Tax=Georgenia yuyongxinii TaxID=2589797 RepID=A0A552WJT8_9MICO|nr:TetR/AcrR family transcriptional regulator [Georgenia yuyongxinii]TRW42949.1 TetR/AcrR family transcriptional regulator [Georgenia yuyongxinii]
MSPVPGVGGTPQPGGRGPAGGNRAAVGADRGTAGNGRVAATGTRREQILDAAADLFARKGFHGVPIDEIGAAVGITGPALYRHFAGKEAILAEMLVGISEQLLAGAQAQLGEDDGRSAAPDPADPANPANPADPADPADPAAQDPHHRAGLDAARATAVLIALVDRHIEFALDHPALITIQFRDLDALPAQDLATVRRLQRAYVGIWADLIRAARGGPPARTDDPHEATAMAHATFGLLNSTPHSARLGRAATARLLHRMALRALLAPDPPALD